MKQVCLLFLILSTVFHLNAQKITAEPGTREYYFQRAAKTNKLGRGLLIAGGGLILIGAVIPKGDLKDDWILWQEYENDGIKAAFLLTGVISLIGSIPTFIVGGSFNRKARKATVSFSNQNIYLAGRGSVISREPTCTLRLPL